MNRIEELIKKGDNQKIAEFVADRKFFTYSEEDKKWYKQQIQKMLSNLDAREPTKHIKSVFIHRLIQTEIIFAYIGS